MYSMRPEPSRSISRIKTISLSSSAIRSFIICLNSSLLIVPSLLESAFLKISSRPSF